MHFFITSQQLRHVMVVLGEQSIAHPGYAHNTMRWSFTLLKRDLTAGTARRSQFELVAMVAVENRHPCQWWH